MSAEQLIDHLSHPAAAAPAAAMAVPHGAVAEFGQGASSAAHAAAAAQAAATHPAAIAAGHAAGQAVEAGATPHDAAAAHVAAGLDEHVLHDQHDAAAMDAHHYSMAMHHSPLEGIVAQPPGHEIAGFTT